MPKRIFILNGHPAENSLSGALADAYAKAARAAGHEVRVAHLSALSFDVDHGRAGYKDLKPLEPVLEATLEDIEWSEHFVITAPMWWGGLPAKLRGFFDRAFLPGRAFDTQVPLGAMPKPMLGGRTARVILTSDTPNWVMRWIYGNALIRQIKNQILGFVGFKTRVTHLSPAGHPKPGAVEAWLRQAGRFGASGL